MLEIRSKPSLGGFARLDLPSHFDPMGHSTAYSDRAVVVRLVESLLSSPSPTGSARQLRVAEIGAWAGMTTMALAADGVQVHAIDHWGGNPSDRLGKLSQQYGPVAAFRVFCSNMRLELFSSVWPHFGTSEMWSSVWRLPLDLVYIDADHRYDQVRKDIHSWWPFVAHGGIIAGHDYGIMQGVTKAVDEFGKDGSESNVWWRVKNG